MVATDTLDDVQIPPVVGENWVVFPIQMAGDPCNKVFGFPATVTGVEGSEVHPFDELVKIKVEIPEVIPVTMPPALTEATPGFVDVHVPPTEGLSVVVFPIQIGLGPVTLTTGLDSTVTALLRVDWQPVLVCVNLKLTVP